MGQEALFGHDERRRKLCERGWRQVAGTIRGQLVWRDPELGALMTEDEAFARLVALDRMEAREKEKQEAPPSKGAGDG